MAKPSKVQSRTERARVALACVWMQFLKLRKTATSQGCKYDVLRGGRKHSTMCGKAAFAAARVASLAWMPTVSQRRIHDCPSLLGFITSSNVAASCTIVVVVAQPFSDVTWQVRSGQGCSGKKASVLPACTICTSMSSGPRSVLKATVNVMASFAFPCSCACARSGAPAGRLVDVHDAVCADSVLVHQAAQLGCVLASCRAGLRSSFTHLAGFLLLKRMPRKSCFTQVLPGRTSSPFASRSSTKPWIVTALRHRTSVTRMMCSLSRVVSAGDSKVLLPSGARGARFRFQPPSSLCLPQAQHVEEPVANNKVDVDLAAVRSAAAGLVFNECSGGTGSADVGELLVCEQPVGGFSRSPPAGRCKRMPCGSSWRFRMWSCRARSHSCCQLGRPPDCRRLWWPTRTNRQGDDAPLGPHVVARGIQTN